MSESINMLKFIPYGQDAAQLGRKNAESIIRMGNEQACLYLCRLLEGRADRGERELNVPDNISLITQAEIKVLNQHFSNIENVKSLDPDKDGICAPKDIESVSIRITRFKEDRMSKFGVDSLDSIRAVIVETIDKKLIDVKNKNSRDNPNPVQYITISSNCGTVTAVGGQKYKMSRNERFFLEWFKANRKNEGQKDCSQIACGLNLSGTRNASLARVFPAHHKDIREAIFETIPGAKANQVFRIKGDVLYDK